MRKSVIVLTVVAVLLMAGAAFAVDTASVAISATVAGTCKVQPGAATAVFAPLDPSVGTDQTAVITNPIVRCTKGQNIAVSVPAGPYTIASGANTIPYTVTVTAGPNTGLGLGAGGDLQIGLTEVKILGVDYVDAAQGNYSGTIVVSYNP